jgi:hypothetical protein
LAKEILCSLNVTNDDRASTPALDNVDDTLLDAIALLRILADEDSKGYYRAR